MRKMRQLSQKNLFTIRSQLGVSISCGCLSYIIHVTLRCAFRDMGHRQRFLSSLIDFKEHSLHCRRRQWRCWWDHAII